IERRCGEIASLPPRRRKDRHADDDQMRVAAAALDEAYMHDVVAFSIGRFDLPQKLGVDRMALFFQHIERKGDISRRDLRTVQEARLGAEPKAVVELVG